MTEKCVVLSPSGVSGMSLPGPRCGVALARSMLVRQLAGVLLRREMGRDLRERGIAEVAGAIVVGAAHRLGHEVQRLRREAIVLLQVEGFEDVEHLHQAGAAGTWRRRAVDVVAAIGAVDRLALDGLVVGEVVGGDQPAARFHLGDELVGDLALCRTRRARPRRSGAASRRDRAARWRSPRLPGFAVGLAEDALKLRQSSWPSVSILFSESA